VGATLLATLDAGTTIFQLTSLTPGSTMTYFVQAYNGSVTARSQFTGVRLPAV
jgi:hypothetical protein